MGTWLAASCSASLFLQLVGMDVTSGATLVPAPLVMLFVLWGRQAKKDKAFYWGWNSPLNFQATAVFAYLRLDGVDAFPAETQTLQQISLGQKNLTPFPAGLFGKHRRMWILDFLMKNGPCKQSVNRQVSDWNHNHVKIACLRFVADCCRYTKKAMALGGGGQTSRLTEVGQTRHQKEMMNPFLICRLRRCYPDTLRKGGQNRRQESCHAVYNSQWFWVLGGWRMFTFNVRVNRRKCADSSMHWTQTMFWTGICHCYLPSHFGQSRAMRVLSSSKSLINSLHRLWSAGQGWRWIPRGHNAAVE